MQSVITGTNQRWPPTSTTPLQIWPVLRSEVLAPSSLGLTGEDLAFARHMAEGAAACLHALGSVTSAGAQQVGGSGIRGWAVDYQHSVPSEHQVCWTWLRVDYTCTVSDTAHRTGIVPLVHGSVPVNQRLAHTRACLLVLSHQGGPTSTISSSGTSTPLADCLLRDALVSDLWEQLSGEDSSGAETGDTLVLVNSSAGGGLGGGGGSSDPGRPDRRVLSAAQAIGAVCVRISLLLVDPLACHMLFAEFCSKVSG
jgi:hypothetical protein